MKDQYDRLIDRLEAIQADAVARADTARAAGKRDIAAAYDWADEELHALLNPDEAAEALEARPQAEAP